MNRKAKTKTTALLADIGGTNTRCALLNDGGDVHSVRVLQNNHYANLPEALEAYCGEESELSTLDAAAIAVAAPVTGDEVRLTNRVWHFSKTALKERLGLSRLEVINDFTAQAAALPFLDANELVQIGGGIMESDSAKAVIGPGTGLGVSGLVPRGDGWAIIEGEGGHVTLASSSDREAEVIALIRERFGHCSAERILSGPGLANLYEVLLVESGNTAEQVMPIEVTSRAADGEATASEAMRLFFDFMGTVASDLALTLGAHGGVYLAGGILPAVQHAFTASGFRSRFENKGRYREYLERIPTMLITARTPALTGLAAVVSGRI